MKYTLATSRAQRYPLYLPNNTSLPIGTYFRLTKSNCKNLQTIIESINNKQDVLENEIVNNVQKIDPDIIKLLLENKTFLKDLSLFEKCTHTTVPFLKCSLIAFFNSSSCYVASALMSLSNPITTSTIINEYKKINLPIFILFSSAYGLLDTYMSYQKKKTLLIQQKNNPIKFIE